MTNGQLLDQDGQVPLEAAARLVRLTPVARYQIRRDAASSTAMLWQQTGLRWWTGRLAASTCETAARSNSGLPDWHAQPVVSSRPGSLVHSPAGKFWRTQLVAASCQVDALGGVRPQFLVTLTQASSPRALTVDSRFTPAEMEVLARLLKGYGANQITKQCCASANTIRRSGYLYPPQGGTSLATRAHRLVRPRLVRRKRVRHQRVAGC